MKLTNFLPLAAFASLATAVPASFSISVSLNEGSLSNPSHPHVDACLAICWPNQHQCAQGQYAWEMGNCWTCCICSAAPRPPKEEEEKFATSLIAQGNKDIGQYHPENMPLLHRGPVSACWKICGDSPILCPKGLYSHKSGDCWTCCTCASAPRESISETGNKLSTGTNAEIELLATDL